MRIRNVKIRNLRAIDDLDLGFAGPDDKPLDLAVLAGPNGCGKTSVLEACLWALKQDKLVPRKLPDQLYSIELEVEHDGERVTVVRDTERHHVLYAPDSRPKQINAFINGTRVFYFSSWRTPKLVGSVGLSVGKGRRPAKTEDNSLWRLKQHLVNIKASTAFEGEPVRPNQSAADLFARINDAWRMFYPDGHGGFDARKAPVPRQTNGKEVDDAEVAYDVYFVDEDHLEGIPIDDLSSGEIEVLGMIGTFVTDASTYDIVVVDEPELHLHPAWHRAILPALRKVAPKTQFICATHSGELLDSVYSFQRFTILDEDDPRVRLLSPCEEAADADE